MFQKILGFQQISVFYDYTATTFVFTRKLQNQQHSLLFTVFSLTELVWDGQRRPKGDSPTPASPDMPQISFLKCVVS